MKVEGKGSMVLNNVFVNLILGETSEHSNMTFYLKIEDNKVVYTKISKRQPKNWPWVDESGILRYES